MEYNVDFESASVNHQGPKTEMSKTIMTKQKTNNLNNVYTNNHWGGGGGLTQGCPYPIVFTPNIPYPKFVTPNIPYPNFPYPRFCKIEIIDPFNLCMFMRYIILQKN